MNTFLFYLSLNHAYLTQPLSQPYAEGPRRCEDQHSRTYRLSTINPGRATVLSYKLSHTLPDHLFILIESMPTRRGSMIKHTTHCNSRRCDRSLETCIYYHPPLGLRTAELTWLFRITVVLHTPRKPSLLIRCVSCRKLAGIILITLAVPTRLLVQ